MKALSIKKSNIVYIGNKKYEVINPTGFKMALLRDPESGETGLYPIHQMRAVPEGEALNKSNDLRYLEHISDELWEKARGRYEMIKPLLKPGRTRKEVEERAKEFSVSAMTLYRLINQYEITGALSSLVPMYENRGGKGKNKLDEQTETVIAQAIEELYLTSQRLTVKKVFQEIKFRCLNADIPVPNENTVRNRIKKLSQREVVKKREGSQASQSLYSMVEGSLVVSHPLDLVQIDHTPLDIIVVDAVYRRPIGRPNLTVAIDVFSRMIYGFYISLDPVGFFTVGQCLYIGSMLKQEFLKRVGVEGEWNIWGLPKSMVLHVDNAREFRGKDLQRLCEEYGISVSFRPKKMPKFGGHVERFIGTLNKEIHSLPGTTFSNTHERGEYDSEGKAVMTIGELETWITHFIVNIYHNTIHSEIGMLPKKKYEIGIFGDESTPGTGLPDIIQGEDAMRLKITLLPSIERTIQRDGVTVENITYYSDVLRKYVELHKAGKKQKYLFKCHPGDISVLYFYAPDVKDYFTIPYRNMGFPPMSIWELREVQKYLKEKNVIDYDENDIFKAYAEMKRIEKDAAEKSKTVRRKHAANQHHRDKMGKDKDLGEMEPLHKVAKTKSENIKKAVDARMDDIFSDPKPFEDIEVVNKKPEYREDET